MPTALLLGAFGQGNLGDEAILQAFTETLYDWDLSASTSEAFPFGGFRSASGPDLAKVPARQPLAVAGRTLSADAVVLAGGTIFKLLPGGTGRRPRALLANAAAVVGSASMLGKPVAMVGVGAGELVGPVAAAYARFLVRHGDLLILRDEESAAALASSGALGPFRVGADPSWALLDAPGASHVSGPARTLVVPSCDAAGRFGGVEAMNRHLAVAIERMTSAGLEVTLQAWQQSSSAGRHDDTTVVEALSRRLGPTVEVVRPPRSLREAIEPMRAFGSVLCYRFHSLVAAAAAGVPAVAVTHELKLAGLARRLGQPAVDPSAPPEALAAAVMHSIDSPGPAPAVVKEEIGLAREGFRLLRVLLSGAADESDQLGALPLVSWPA